MKREHESMMFMTAVKGATESTSWRNLKCIAWADMHHCQDFHAVVLSPKGSTFKHRAAVARCATADSTAVTLLDDFDPTFVAVREGGTFFYYKDGYDVLASTGALAAIRREQES
ncbi:hypothetical protein HOR19_gp16 [Phage MedPE-SWcel-C56]|uniref:Uncharacterized protein n=1 Tax=Phage MedPE-SWcel-C56 TaxID=1871314 RepID=A0A1B1IY09_9CAUD|nr:hypothetical protein HOR19_gp16 [Phage MedPE-SWcel-C56]ANS06209.1 hypothetical protein [Phage MedPE-SWcel-C56]